MPRYKLYKFVCSLYIYSKIHYLNKFLQKFIKNNNNIIDTVVLIKCFHCDYQWNTNSKMIKINCPSCRRTINNAEDKEND